MRAVLRPARIAFAIAGIAAMLLVACGGNSRDSSGPSGRGAAPDTKARLQNARGAGDKRVAGAGSAMTTKDSTKQQPAAAGPPIPGLPDRIVKTAELSLEVKDGSFDQTWARVLQAAVRLGGYVASSDRATSRSDDDRLYGSVTIRVPARKFEEAMIALRGLGKITGDTSSSEDVTQEFVDLESRLRNLRAQQSVLLRLMDKARTIGETLNVQQPLSAVQGEIEQLTGRRNALSTLTDFSTITVNVAEPGAIAPGSGSRFEKAWDTAVQGLAGIATVVFVGVIWAVPLALVAAAGLGLSRRLRRRIAPQV